MVSERTAPATGAHEGRLAGRRAIVTGAARGIGASIATALHREGATLALLDKEEALCQRTAASLDARAFAVELADPASARAAMQEIGRASCRERVYSSV